MKTGFEMSTRKTKAPRGVSPVQARATYQQAKGTKASRIARIGKKGK